MPPDAPPPPEGFSLVTPPAGFSLVPASGPPLPPGFSTIPAAPQWTRSNPFIPKTQAEIDAASPGTWIKNPKTGALHLQPVPTPEAAASIDTATGEELDFSGVPAAPKPPGLLGTGIEAAWKGLVHGVKDTAQVTDPFTKRPTEAPDTSPVGELLATPFEQGWYSPKWLVAQIMHGMTSSAPAMAGGVLGALGGAGAGSAIAGPIGTAAGAFAGGVSGYGLMSAVQSIGPAYQKALSLNLPHDKAVDAAWVDSGLAAIFGSLAAALPAGSLFGRNAAGAMKNRVSEALAQIFAVQPAVGAIDQIQRGQAMGQLPTPGEVATGMIAEIGGGAGLAAGHAAAGRMLGHGQPATGQTGQTDTSPGSDETLAPPAGGSATPPIGTSIVMPMGDGTAQPLTVARHTPEGDVVLTDAEGLDHRLTAADVARFGKSPEAAQAAEADTPGPAVAPSAAERPSSSDTGSLDDLFRASESQDAATQPGGVTPIPPQAVTDEAIADLNKMAQPARTDTMDPFVPTNTTTMEIGGQRYTIAPNPDGGYDIDAGPVGILYAPTHAAAVEQVRSIARDPNAAVRPPELAAAPALDNIVPIRPAASTPEPPATQSPPETPAQPVQPPSAPEPPAPVQSIQTPVAGWDQLILPGHGIDLVGRPLAPDQADGTLRLYRGEGGGSMGSIPDGNWFTTDQAKAALYGTVRHVDISANDLRSFARGASNDEFFAPNGLPEAPEIIRIVPENPEPIAPIEHGNTTIEVIQPDDTRTSETIEASDTRASETLPNQNIGTEPRTEAEPNAPTISDEKHTKTGKDIFAVRFAQKPNIDGLGAEARRLQGYWSSFRGGGMQPGWMFKTHEAADQFAAWARGKLVAQDFAGNAEAAGQAAFAAGAKRIPANDPALRRLLRQHGKVRSSDILTSWLKGWDRANIAEPVPTMPDRPVEYNAPEPEPTRAPRSEQDIGREVVKAREDTETEPSDAQKEAGNYAHGRVNFHGLHFVMENPVGSLRRGVDADGKPWETELPADYGYISRTDGADGEPVDAYLGPHLVSQRAWVIDQVHAETGTYDEAKVLLGFNDWPTAREAYIDAFSDGRGADRIGNVTPMSLDELKAWLKEGDTKNPIGQQALPLDGARSREEVPVALSRPEPLPPIPADAGPQLRLAGLVERALGGNERLTARDLQALAEREYGSTLAEGKFTRADIYDAVELGVNRYITAHSVEFDPRANLTLARMIVRELEELKSSLPTQTVRAGEKEAMQQFSTPPDYSFAAAWMAKIGPNDRVLEPSAGTGSIVAFMKNASPAEVIVNELSGNRAPLVESLGPDRAFRENAEQLNNILPKDVRPTVVVMNPPFSQTAGRMGNRMVAGTGARHVEQALARLEPGGRLVAIVGRGMRAYTGSAPSGVRFGEGTGASFRDWWARIAREYDVRANVGVPGEVYGKYGTTFGTQLLVIDKNPPSGRPAVIADATSIADLMEKLDGVRNDRNPIVEGTSAAEQLAAQPGGEASAAGSEGVAGSGVSVPRPTSATGVRAGSSDTGPWPGLPPGPRTGSEPTGRPGPEARPGDVVAPQQPERGGTVGAERHPESGTGERPDLGNSGAEPDAMVLRPEGESGSVLPPSTEGGITEGPAPEVVRVEEAAANSETAAGITENVYEPYKPQRITIKGAVEHPTKLVQSAAMASVLLPEVSYVPRLPRTLITEGKLSDAQLEAVIYAGHAHSQMLPAVEGEPIFRRGFFDGDGTGTGKGATVAGIILDNWAQGRQRALWLSESRTLIKDAQRDWAWLGRDPKEIFDVGKAAKPSADIKMGKGIGFLTYDTLKGYERQGKDEAGATIKGQTRVDQIVNWLGKGFDGVIALDESHNLSNSIQVKGTRGIKDAAAKALAGIELQQKLPNARVVYVSATGATEVMNLAYAERLGLWGRGTAFPSKAEFIGQISSGGVAAMELVARDMKAMGSYISRNLSYDGVEYTRLEHPLTPEQHQIYDDLAEGWQTVLRNIEAALLKTGAPDEHGNPKADGRQRGNALSAFWSGHQRFFNQIITSMQMPSVIRGIEGDLKEGRQAVLQLVNTNEASQERAISRARAEEGGDLEDLDMTPRDQLMQMIDKSFPTAQRETYVDENGNERTRDVLDSAGNIVHNPEALAMKDELLSKLGSIRVPDGPLEMLINHFGTDKVAEITGRKQRVVRKADEAGQIKSQVESRPGSANLTEADAFQNAKKPILVFSQAGMTGRSYHADLSTPSADARRSHYLVQAGWRADKAIQGFGRTHRTNQATAPIFHLVTTDLEGQRRFISSIARRLAQLGALTKGERRAGESGMFSARDNLESNEATAALGALWRDIQSNRIETIVGRDFEQQTGLKLRDLNGESTQPPPITQFLNRLLSLKFDMQNHVFGEFNDRLNTAIDRAAAAGTLDVGTETLKADRLTKEDDRIVHTDAQSGAETRYVRLKVENKTDPATFTDVSNGRHRTGGDKPEFFVLSKRTGKIMAVTPSHDVTDASTGNIIPQYRLTDPLIYRFADRHRIEGRGSDQYWERIDDRATAKKLWDEQVKALPEYVAHNEHLITGAILPIWDRLGSWPRVYRLQTDAGEKLLGRTVAEKDIDRVLKALGAEGTGRQYAPAEVAEAVLGGGRATLANDWSLRRSMVAGEPRIEIIGPNYTHDAELRNAGVFTERIGYTTRYFVPTGEDAPRVLESVLERRPVTELTGGREEGLAEDAPQFWEGERGRPGPIRDLRDDYAQFRGEADPHRSARDWTNQRGEETGFEHLVAHAGEDLHAYTTGMRDAVAFSPELFRSLDDETAAAVVHHNHPGGSSLSGQDVAQLALPGLDTIVAHAGGDTFIARLTPEAKMWALAHSDRAGGVIGGLYRDAVGPVVRKRLQSLIDRANDPLSPADSDRLYADLTNRALDAAGVLDYMSSRSLAPLQDFWAKALIREAATQARRVADAYHIPSPAEEFDARVHRSTVTIRPEESLVRLSGDAGATAAGRPRREAGEGRGREDAESGQGLAEESPPDFAGEVESETVDQAIGPPGEPKGAGWSRRFFNTLGVGSRSPGRSEHAFNVVNWRVTAPSNAARYDIGGVSRQKWQAETDKRDDTSRLRHSYVEGLKTWLGASKEEAQTLAAALELTRLQNREFPLDGRAIILENAKAPHAKDPLAHQPMAWHSQPGDVLRLDKPRLIEMFGEIRRTMDKGWDDLTEATARRYGWEGEPTSKAILNAAEDADTGRDKNRLTRVAKMVGAIEYARRTAYVPFMRFGDYYFHVLPKEGTEGWTGEGRRPTEWFSLIDSRLPEEKVIGGRRGASETASAMRDELEKRFDPELYEIREGYWHPTEDALKQIGIPAIEKLFTLMGNDTEKVWQARARSSEIVEHPSGKGFAIRFADGDYARADRHGSNPGEILRWDRETDADVRAVAHEAMELQEKAIESLLDQVYEEMQAGFKKRARNVPGYDKDLSRSIGIYFNWLSSHIAGIRHRDAIDEANQQVDRSYDPLARQFWRDWDDYQNRENTPLDGAFQTARNAAFYWALGLNASSTFKNMLDGPMIHMPVLTTGLGAQGRAYAIATYVNAQKDILKSFRVGKQGFDVDPLRGAKTPAERALLEDAEALGITRPKGFEEMAAIRRGGIEALTPQQRFNRRVLDIWGSNMAATDRLTRSSMLLAAYRTANRAGMASINRVWGRDKVWAGLPEKTPEAFAKFMVERTSGIWGGANRIPVMRSNLGAAVGQFQSYSLNYLSTIYQMMRSMGPEGIVSGTMMLGGVAMLGGAIALPLAEDALKATELVYHFITQTDIDLKTSIAKAIEALGFDKEVGELALHGVSRQAFGFDLSSIGLNFLSDFGRGSGIELLGPAASILAGAPLKAHERAIHGQSDAAWIAELMPSPVKNLLKGTVVYPEEGIRTLRGGVNAQVLSPEQISAGEAALAGAGFQPTKIARAYEEREFERRAGQIAKQPTAALNKRLEGLYARLVFAHRRGEQEESEDLKSQIMEAIRTAPAGARPSLEAIRKSIAQALQPQAAALKSAPRRARPEILNTPYIAP